MSIRPGVVPLAVGVIQGVSAVAEKGTESWVVEMTETVWTGGGAAPRAPTNERPPADTSRSGANCRTNTSYAAPVDAPVESVTCTVMTKSPGAVGVPLKSPVESNVKPAGSGPEAVHINGRAPPFD